MVFTTRQPFDSLPARLVYIYVTGQPEPGGATGPYRLGRRAEGNVVLEAFPDYRDGRAPIATVEFRIVKDPRERARRLLRREADLIEDIVPDDMPELRAASGIRTLALPGFTTAFLAMDMAPAADPDVEIAGQPLPGPAGARGDGPGDRPACAGVGAAPGLRRPHRPARAAGPGGLRSSLEPTAPDVPGARSLLRQAGTPTASRSSSTTCRGRGRRGRDAGPPAGGGGHPPPAAGQRAGEFLARLERHDTSLYLCAGSSRARRSRRPTRGSCTRPGASSAR